MSTWRQGEEASVPDPPECLARGPVQDISHLPRNIGVIPHCPLDLFNKVSENVPSTYEMLRPVAETRDAAENRTESLLRKNTFLCYNNTVQLIII